MSCQSLVGGWLPVGKVVDERLDLRSHRCGVVEPGGVALSGGAFALVEVEANPVPFHDCETTASLNR